MFVGEGWHLTLGALFMVIVIFLPGGLMEGVQSDLAMIAKNDEARRCKPVEPPGPAE